jgi:hypothetical protein
MECVAEHCYEVAPNGFTRAPPVHLAARGQHEEIKLGLAAFPRFVMEQVRFRSPNSEMTPHSLDLLGEFGLRHDSSFTGDDAPAHSLPTASPGRAAVHWLRIEMPPIAAELWIAEIDAMLEFRPPRVLAVRPFVAGQGSLLRVLERFIGFALSCKDIRFSRADDVAVLILGGPERAVGQR